MQSKEKMTAWTETKWNLKQELKKNIHFFPDRTRKWNIVFKLKSMSVNYVADTRSAAEATPIKAVGSLEQMKSE